MRPGTSATVLPSGTSVCYSEQNSKKASGSYHTVTNEGRYTDKEDLPRREKRAYPADHYLTRVIPGHDCFWAYLYKFKYEGSVDCPACEGIERKTRSMYFCVLTFQYFSRYTRNILKTTIDTGKPGVVDAVIGKRVEENIGAKQEANAILCYLAGRAMANDSLRSMVVPREKKQCQRGRGLGF
ncbi:hypothetical protein J6590_077802 [Homalodisca vitripennis]|nr:hypothetical protein J6590_077802 [Homalodisca vitripennis]